MPFPLACRVFVEETADNLMGIPLYVVIFPLLIFYLSLCIVSLITMCLCVFLLGFILPGTFCTSWTWLTISFPMLGKFSAIISSNIFSSPFSPPSGTPTRQMLVHLMLSQRSLRLSSFFFLRLYSCCGSGFHHSVPQVTYPFICISYSAINSF